MIMMMNYERTPLMRIQCMMMIKNDAKCFSVGVWNSGQILVGIKRHSTQSLSEIQFLCRGHRTIQLEDADASICLRQNYST